MAPYNNTRFAKRKGIARMISARILRSCRKLDREDESKSANHQQGEETYSNSLKGEARSFLDFIILLALRYGKDATLGAVEEWLSGINPLPHDCNIRLTLNKILNILDYRKTPAEYGIHEDSSSCGDA